MSNALSEEELDDIQAKIDSEGFDYYFSYYGPDERLKALIGLDIKNYQDARKNLINALADVGIELEL